MWLEVLAAVVVAVAGGKVWYKKQSGRCVSKARLDGKTVIITGASAGLGKEAAKDLVGRGARVIMACRNMDKAERVADELRQHAEGKGEVVVREVDTSDLASVRRFANKILKEESKLDILINNAGIVGPKTRQVTKDGLELSMATNHFGHFLLTNMLLDLLKRSAPSRIVTTSSDSHENVIAFNADSLNFEHQPYTDFHAYGLSKLCNILFTRELTDKLKGTGVTANCIHPGYVISEIFYKGPVSWTLWLLGWVIEVLGKDTTLGAQTLVHAAVSEELEGVSGKYLVDCKEAETTELGKSRKYAQELWIASEAAVKLKPDEKHY